MCTLVFYALHSDIYFFLFWSTGVRLVIMSVQYELICIHLLMLPCMFSIQLFLHEIVKFHFDRK